MAEVSVSALEGGQRKLVDNARVALEQGNVAYALEACAEVLNGAPACVAVRRLQRAAALRQWETRNRFIAKAVGTMSATPFMFGASRRTPEETLAVADKLLAMDPTNATGLRMLGEAARALGWGETAVFAFQALVEERPDEQEARLALGDAWLTAGNAAEALASARRILNVDAVDAGALDLLRRASVAQTMAQGNWAAGGTFREKAKR